MRIDPDTCTDAVLLAAEVRRLRAIIAAGDADHEPAAWLACATDGRDDLAEVYISATDAEKAALAWQGRVTPLFFGVGLTQEERQAIFWVCGDVADITGPIEATLRGLLERTQTVKT